jgi:hypothetical protein
MTPQLVAESIGSPRKKTNIEFRMNQLHYLMFFLGTFINTGQNLFRILLISFSLVLLVFLTRWPEGAVKTEPPVSLVLISIDGMKPDYVLEADKHQLKIPNLRRLVREGTFASGVKGVLPTVTYPSHTTMVSGVSPAKHGIVANIPFGRHRPRLSCRWHSRFKE